MLNWFRKPKPRPQVQIRAIQRDVTRVGVKEWRSDPESCKQAAEAIRQPVLRGMLDVLNAQLRRNTRESSGLNTEGRACHSAIMAGYEMAITDLESLGTPIQLDEEPLEAEFKAESREHLET